MDSGRDKPLVIAEATKAGAFIVAPVVDALVKEIQQRKTDVIKIDPFVSSHHVPENDNGAQDMVVKEWGRVAEFGNCAVHLIDHTRKMGEGEVTTESARGGKAKTDDCRVVRAVNRMMQKEGADAGVENHRLYFRTYNDKANLQPPADKSDWYKLVSVDLPNGHLHGPGDSVGVVTTWKWPDPTADVTGADFDKVAAVIRRGTPEKQKWRENVKAKDWVGYALAKALELDTDNDSNRAKIRSLIKYWLKTEALRRVQLPDEHRELRWFVEVSEESD